MIYMYCRNTRLDAMIREQTAGEGLCQECAALLEYSRRRVEKCPFGDRKPTCARCTVHCFRADMREQVRVVMRYSGPRMILRHPYFAVRHLLDRRRTPEGSQRL
jgi:hypothetical protein